MSHQLLHSLRPSHLAWTVPRALIAFIGSVVVVGLLLTIGFDRVLDAVKPARISAQAAPVPVVAAPARLEPQAGSGVPDAATVFQGRDTLVEESAPTF